MKQHKKHLSNFPEQLQNEAMSCCSTLCWHAAGLQEKWPPHKKHLVWDWKSDQLGAVQCALNGTMTLEGKRCKQMQSNNKSCFWRWGKKTPLPFKLTSLRTRMLYPILFENLVKSSARCNKVKVDLSLTPVSSERKQPVATACAFTKRLTEQGAL